MLHPAILMLTMICWIDHLYLDAGAEISGSSPSFGFTCGTIQVYSVGSVPDMEFTTLFGFNDPFSFAARYVISYIDTP